jgi:16S rRNA (adenine1518-N6/adenine1519-N6)-dimethyltransferase
MARQRLGQHFLASAAWRERIAHAVLQPRERAEGMWIEIGAGHGEMTTLLARQAKRVVAIELDAKLIAPLQRLAADLGNVTVVSGDVLSQDVSNLAGSAKVSVYGNLPYYITSPIVHHLCAYIDHLEAAFLVVQREVGARLAARPGSRDYGYLSTFTQFHAKSEILLRIPPGAFRPPPKVDSALVALRPPGMRATLDVPDERGFLEFLKTCFAQKRKTLRNNLRTLVSSERAEAVIAASGLRLDVRAEQVSLAEFARLFANLQKHR